MVHEIDLFRKRTYEIEDDKLLDFFDSDIVANDELLTKCLAKSKKAVLGEIIGTIQKEQNEIIRKSPRTNLIVQGVAGSGKTTVAMHRISYILYNYAGIKSDLLESNHDASSKKTTFFNVLSSEIFSLR